MVKWTAEYDQRLLFLIASEVKVKGSDIARAWAEKYGDGKDAPNGRSIDEHLWKLKTGRAGSAASDGAAVTKPPRKGPATPRTPKATTPKTPATSGKRARETMSEQDDSEPEQSKVRLVEGIGRRGSIPRSRKDSAKSYKEDSSDEEDGGDKDQAGEDAGVADSKMGGADIGADGLDAFLNFDGAAEQEVVHRTGATPTKKGLMHDDGNESDISSFSEALA